MSNQLSLIKSRSVQSLLRSDNVSAQRDGSCKYTWGGLALVYLCMHLARDTTLDIFLLINNVYVG